MQPVHPNRRTVTRPVRTARVAGAAAGPLLALLLAACGSNSTPTVTSGGAANTPAPAQSSQGAPGTVGLVASLSGNTLEVQSPNAGQVTVDFSSSTRITRQQSAALSAIKAGDCLNATGTPTADGAGVTARTITISTPTGGSCTAGRGAGGFGGGGFGGGGFGGGRGNRSAAPRPSGSPRENTSVSGTVTAVSGSRITVNGMIRTGGGPRASTAPAAKTLAVTIDSTTRYTSIVAATTSALKVGECVAAVGSSNDIGAIQATSISIFQAAQNGCTFGRGPGGGGSAAPGGTNG